MPVTSGQSVAVTVTTRNPETGTAANASAISGTLLLNGEVDAAAVTVGNEATGRYKASVTLPTLAAGDGVEILITATVAGVSDSVVVWRDGSAATALPSISVSGTTISVTDR